MKLLSHTITLLESSLCLPPWSLPTALWLLYDFLSLKNDVNENVPSKSIKQKKGQWGKGLEPEPYPATDPESEPYPDPLIRGANPDPYHNVTDPQHWKAISEQCRFLWSLKRSFDKYFPDPNRLRDIVSYAHFEAIIRQLEFKVPELTCGNPTNWMRDLVST